MSTDFKKDCLNCYVLAQSTDWTYFQGYPVFEVVKVKPAVQPWWLWAMALKERTERYVTFGHDGLPHAETVAESPVAECAQCRISTGAKTNVAWVRCDPVPRGKSE